MKLSDIDNMKKLAHEWKMANDFYMALCRRTYQTLRIDFTDHSSQAKFDLTVQSHNIEPLTFAEDIKTAVKKRLDLLRTKLVMMGVETFEGEYIEK